MSHRHSFNSLIIWKETLEKAKEISFICEECKQKMDKAIKRIDSEIEQIIDESDGVLI